MKKKITKYLITIFLLLLVLIPIGYFLIFPNYNTLIGSIQRLDTKRIAYDIYFSFLTEISPTKEQVLGTNSILVENSSIEEYLDDSIEIDPILEKLNTQLHIDSVDIEGNIFQGINSKTMDKGFWHFPTSVYPGQKGNSVIISHRFLHVPPAKDTFFNLDKVKKGDSVVIEQENDKYTYIVSDVKIVEKNDVSVLQNSDDYQITLITCTPLWTSHQRLVVTGKLDKLYQKT
jgi:LPXTG-site transpeptidase (sortase) family protein